jgi:hypothetical protein
LNTCSCVCKARNYILLIHYSHEFLIKFKHTLFKCLLRDSFPLRSLEYRVAQLYVS